jgi:hypothetical protein
MYRFKSILIGMLSIALIGMLFACSEEAEANETAAGYSTLPGWSAGYRYYFDMDEDEKSKMRLFGKYKQVGGNTIKFGWDRQTGKDINQFDANIDDDGVIFFEQEFKF